MEIKHRLRLGGVLGSALLCLSSVVVAVEQAPKSVGVKLRLKDAKPMVDATLDQQRKVQSNANDQLMRQPAEDFEIEELITLPLDTTKTLALPPGTANVLVASSEIATAKIVGLSTVFITAKNTGSTNIFFISAGGQVIGSTQLDVVLNIESLRQAIKVLAPEDDVNVLTVGNNLVLQGAVSSVAVAADIEALAKDQGSASTKVLNLVKVKDAAQIYLQVKVVEMSRQIINRIGLNTWELIFQPTDEIRAVIGSTASPVSLFTPLSGTNYNLSGLINLLNENGMAEIVSEPNLVAASGQRANFLSGGEFPIIVPFGIGGGGGGSGGGGNNAVQYKKYGVSLNFLPTLIDKNAINLEVSTEVSALSTEGAVELNGFSVPSLTTRRAATSIQIKSGQSFAIAGLTQKTNRVRNTKVPVLGDIPLLGALFRSTDNSQDQKELVIIVTPYLVNPTSAQLATPNRGSPNYQPKAKAAAVNTEAQEALGKTAIEPIILSPKDYRLE